MSTRHRLPFFCWPVPTFQAPQHQLRHSFCIPEAGAKQATGSHYLFAVYRMLGYNPLYTLDCIKCSEILSRCTIFSLLSPLCIVRCIIFLRSTVNANNAVCVMRHGFYFAPLKIPLSVSSLLSRCQPSLCLVPKSRLKLKLNISTWR